jgi:hypothetical protein
MFEITCIKKDSPGLGKLWCFDYCSPDGYLVTDEPLMHEASAMIDSFLIAKHHEDVDTIYLTFETTPSNTWDFLLDYVRAKDDGTIYHASCRRPPNLMGEVWLCPVLDLFFPERKPAQLYVYITPVFKEQNEEHHQTTPVDVLSH